MDNAAETAEKTQERIRGVDLLFKAPLAKAINASVPAANVSINKIKMMVEFVIIPIRTSMVAGLSMVPISARSPMSNRGADILPETENWFDLESTLRRFVVSVAMKRTASNIPAAFST